MRKENCHINRNGNTYKSMIDLHLHSYYSFDGVMSLEEIVLKSKELGLSVISLTDHDSISGVKEIIEIGRKNNLTVIPGIEISTVLSHRIPNIPFYARLHILGYQFNYDNPKFQEKLDQIKKENIERLRKIQSYFEKKCHLKADNKMIETREELLESIVKFGFAKTRSEAKKVIDSNEVNELYPPAQMSTKEAISFIIEMGGIPVLAHAYEGSYKALYSDQEVSNLIDYLITIGIKGIETHHYLHLDDNRSEKLLAIAKKYDLITTVGSDCHSHTKLYGSKTGYEGRYDVIKSSENCNFDLILKRLRV